MGLLGGTFSKCTYLLRCRIKATPYLVTLTDCLLQPKTARQIR